MTRLKPCGHLGPRMGAFQNDDPYGVPITEAIQR